ncbi:50S ribosomal protein L11 [Candidatus Woesearchaeota archaeon]|nr:50S ribosomal protein L11 [Candidatus Woesearchaeota archaeon]
MAIESVEALVEGGKASAAPPLGPALGPLGVNIGDVIQEINKKTGNFKGMQVPVKVEVDSDSKEFTISVGTPPASALLKKEAGVDKGSGRAGTEAVADLAIEQIIKVSQMKEDDILGKTPKDRVKEIIGTCVSMGVNVGGTSAKEALKLVEKGRWDKEIESGKTELTAEEKKKLDEERKAMQAELEKKHAEVMDKAQTILDAAKASDKDTNATRADLEAAGIPDDLIEKLAPKKQAGAADEAPPVEKKE